MVRTFLGVEKSETQGSRFYVKQLYHDTKTVWNSHELLLLFNWTFLGLRSGPLDFFGSGSSLKDFFWV